MLPLDDERWNSYRSGYNRVVLDTSAWVRDLLGNKFGSEHWDYLWDQLHHQGDIGEASYAVVPYLAEYASLFKVQKWDLWGFPVVVELARLEGNNPELPKELEDSYFSAYKRLSNIACNFDSWDEEPAPCMSSCIALTKGQTIFARAYLEMTSKSTALDFIKEETGWEPISF